MTQNMDKSLYNLEKLILENQINNFKHKAKKKLSSKGTLLKYPIKNIT